MHSANWNSSTPGQLWHSLPEDEYRAVLLNTLEDVEAELSGEEFLREDHE